MDRSDYTKTLDVRFHEKKKLLFIHLSSTHQKYLQFCKANKIKSITLSELNHYLNFDKSFIGKTKGKKFNGTTKMAFVFDVSYLNEKICTNSGKIHNF